MYRQGVGARLRGDCVAQPEKSLDRAVIDAPWTSVTISHSNAMQVCIVEHVMDPEAAREARLEYPNAVGAFFLDLADRSLAQDDLESCLRYAHLAATVHSRQNKLLFSARIEQITRSVALRLHGATDWRTTDVRRRQSMPTVLHVLTEALPAGGLTAMATRWMTLDASNTTSHVVLLETAVPIPLSLSQATALGRGAIHTAPHLDSYVEKARWLRALAHELADYVVLHIDVSDVVCGAAFNTAGGPPILLVNHTAHTFWTGVSYADSIANCRGSALERKWIEAFRANGRQCIVPIPLNDRSDAACKEGDLHNGRGEQAIGWRRKLELPAEAVVMLTVGARFKYAPLKDLDFLQIMTSVLVSNPSAYLLAAGFDADPRWKQASARAAGRILVLGRLDQQELFQLYASTDIYVEGFPFGTTTALLEAASIGTAVVLAPAPCFPPYSTDGIAIDNLIEQAPSVGSYKEYLGRLIANAALRAEVGARVRTSVLDHHAGNGWTAHLHTALSALPATHAVYPIAAPHATPRHIHDYWSNFAPQWTWPAGETLEHMLIRALQLGLRPSIDRASRHKLSQAAGADDHGMPLWMIASLCNLPLAVFSARTRMRLLRSASFLFRPNVVKRSMQRLARLSGKSSAAGAYDEYRLAASPSNEAAAARKSTTTASASANGSAPAIVHDAAACSQSR